MTFFYVFKLGSKSVFFFKDVTVTVSIKVTVNYHIIYNYILYNCNISSTGTSICFAFYSDSVLLAQLSLLSPNILFSSLSCFLSCGARGTSGKSSSLRFRVPATPDWETGTTRDPLAPSTSSPERSASRATGGRDTATLDTSASLQHRVPDMGEHRPQGIKMGEWGKIVKLTKTCKKNQSKNSKNKREKRRHSRKSTQSEPYSHVSDRNLWMLLVCHCLFQVVQFLAENHVILLLLFLWLRSYHHGCCFLSFWECLVISFFSFVFLSVLFLPVISHNSPFWCYLIALSLVLSPVG